MLAYRFEELPGFCRDGFYAGMFDGIAEIAFEPSGEWFVTEIRLACDNRQLGVAAQGKYIGLTPHDGQLFAELCTAICDLCADHIQARISEALEDEGFSLASENNEHRIREVL